MRRAKRFLRYLPRRAVLHRYPFIKFFAGTARKQPYLWSFRTQYVIPALYAGSIISFMPLYGVQIPLAFGAALLFRANLMVTVALQFITNPFTVIPIYTAAYHLGNFILSSLPAYTPPFLPEAVDAETVGVLGEKGRKAVRLFWATSVGGLVIGYFFAFITGIVYRISARKAATSHFFHSDSTNDDSGKKNP